MRRILMVATLVAALLVLAVAASADSSVAVRANVPFSFYVGNGVVPQANTFLRCDPSAQPTPPLRW